MIIKDFFSTIQKDMVLIFDKVSGNLTNQTDQDKRVAFACLRIFATMGMGIGILVAASALPRFAPAPVATLFKMGFGALIYAFNHDVFIISKNSTDQLSPLNQVAAAAKSLWKDLFDIAAGKKNNNIAPNQPLTEDTLFQPLWNECFARL